MGSHCVTDDGLGSKIAINGKNGDEKLNKHDCHFIFVLSIGLVSLTPTLKRTKITASRISGP